MTTTPKPRDPRPTPEPVDNRTPLEIAQDTATAAITTAEEATAEALKWRIATRYGVSEEDAGEFLTSHDEEILIKFARRLGSKGSPVSTPSPTTSN